MTKINIGSLDFENYDELLDECSEININHKIEVKKIKEKRKIKKDKRKSNSNEVVE